MPLFVFCFLGNIEYLSLSTVLLQLKMSPASAGAGLRYKKTEVMNGKRRYKVSVQTFPAPRI